MESCHCFSGMVKRAFIMLNRCDNDNDNSQTEQDKDNTTYKVEHMTSRYGDKIGSGEWHCVCVLM